MPTHVEVLCSSSGRGAKVDTTGALHTVSAKRSYRNIAGAATTVVKSGTITQPLTLLASQIVLEFGCAFTNGLTVVTSAADDVTVIYL